MVSPRISVMKKSKSELTKVFENFLKEYILSESSHDTELDTICIPSIPQEIARNREKSLVSEFLSTPCVCGTNCQNQFSEHELLEAREHFRS